MSLPTKSWSPVVKVHVLVNHPVYFLKTYLNEPPVVTYIPAGSCSAFHPQLLPLWPSVFGFRIFNPPLQDTKARVLFERSEQMRHLFSAVFVVLIFFQDQVSYKINDIKHQTVK